jgi:hypothetical protein
MDVVVLNYYRTIASTRIPRLYIIVPFSFSESVGPSCGEALDGEYCRCVANFSTFKTCESARELRAAVAGLGWTTPDQTLWPAAALIFFPFPSCPATNHPCTCAFDC